MTDTELRRVRRALEGDSDGLHERILPLDDIEILSRAKGGDGRTLVAYAATFGHRAEIHDQDGHYTEENHPQAFNKSIADKGVRFGVFYHHAKTLHGTPSERGSVPLGRPVQVKPDGRGLLTHTALNRNQLADEVLESVRNGDPMGMSFTGAYLQSDPQRAPYYSRSDGSLQHVVRKEIALIEYGPTPIPAYADAAILGVRAAQLREQEAEQEPERESVTLNGRTAAPADAGDAPPQDARPAERAAAAADTDSEDEQDTPEDLGDGWVKDPDGTVRFDPDGDGDDDSTPEGDSDHDYWSADGEQLKLIPPRPAASRNGQDAPEASRAAGTARHEPVNGSHSHPHPAYGSQGGDAMHSHTHTHDDDAAHRHAHDAPAGDSTSSRSTTATLALCRHFGWTPEQAEALSGQERTLLLLSIAAARGIHERAAAVDRSAWDAAKAWAAGASSDDPAAFYNAICAGRKEGDPKTQAAHALPHHYAPGDPPNADGVRNSLSRLPQTDGLTNTAAAKAHLEAHMKVISPPASSGD